MSQSLADQLATSALSGANADFIEHLYERFLQDPAAVDPVWSAYFAALKGNSEHEVAHGELRARLASRPERPAAAASLTAGASQVASAKQGAVSRLIQVYANRGHLIANLDPLGLQERAKPYVLNLEYFGLSDADLGTEFFTNSRTAAIPARSKLRDILQTLKFIYCDTIGAEFAHVSDSDKRIWLQDNFQAARMQRRFSVEEKKNILWQLTAAEGLERYLHTKYVGQKRFSLEGGDSLIPLLDDLVQHAFRPSAFGANFGYTTLEANPLFPWSPPLAAYPESPFQSPPPKAAGTQLPCTPPHRAPAVRHKARAPASPARSNCPPHKSLRP